MPFDQKTFGTAFRSSTCRVQFTAECSRLPPAVSDETNPT